MESLRRNWIFAVVAAWMAVAAVVFVAHLGMEEHPESCEACNGAAHLSLLLTPTSGIAPADGPTGRVTPLRVCVATEAFAEGRPSPRAPPHS